MFSRVEALGGAALAEQLAEAIRSEFDRLARVSADPSLLQGHARASDAVWDESRGTVNQKVDPCPGAL